MLTILAAIGALVFAAVGVIMLVGTAADLARFTRWAVRDSGARPVRFLNLVARRGRWSARDPRERKLGQALHLLGAVFLGLVVLGWSARLFTVAGARHASVGAWGVAVVVAALVIVGGLGAVGRFGRAW